MADLAGPDRDRDLTSIHEARTLARRAKQAQAALAEFSQAQIDACVDAIAAAAKEHAEAFARLAVEETGYGVVADKLQKNLFSAEKVYRFIRPMKTVGVIRRLDESRVVEIAEPFGVVAAIIPSTNPTSTAIYKILIAIKARCALVISPHPHAVGCITRVAEVLAQAARGAGAPEGAINWMTVVTIEGTQELMKHGDVAVILATGGMGLVRAAYSAGKPAYGVGPGNAPAYVERSAEVRKAVGDIITGKTFDNGVLCSSENAVVVDEAISSEVSREFERQGGRFLSDAEMDALAKVLVTSERLPNPALVGKPAVAVAARAGISVPPDTRVLLAPLAGVGRDYPLSIEKLCPVLAFYVVNDWREGCERCKQILAYGGMGHTMAIHSRNEQVILEFGLKKPAFRIVVNTPTTHGSIGLTTGLDPAMTLGCGGFGGNITSDNISPRHLLNIKRLAYEITPAIVNPTVPAPVAPRLPEAPPRPVQAGIDPETLARRIDTFLRRRGFDASASAAPSTVNPAPSTQHPALSTPSSAPSAPPPAPSTPGPAPSTTPAGAASPHAAEPVAFVCEDDVRQAMRANTKIIVGDRTIITPAARDLGNEHRVFVQAGWRGTL